MTFFDSTPMSAQKMFTTLVHIVEKKDPEDFPRPSDRNALERLICLGGGDLRDATELFVGPIVVGDRVRHLDGVVGKVVSVDMEGRGRIVVREDVSFQSPEAAKGARYTEVGFRALCSRVL